ncbi:MAG: ABC transporter substrate binding protein [Sulfurimonas sp.]|nr:ABC transporter substrate binding protein [Sulfurimonas sp.]
MKLFKFVWVSLYFGAFTCLLAQPVIHIGIVMDGKNEDLEQTKSLFIDEIQRVSQGEFIIDFPESKQLDGQFSVTKINAAIDSLQNDKKIDYVVMIGRISSQLSLHKSSITKPTFAPFVYNVSISDFTYNHKNAKLNYISSEIKLPSEIDTFKSIVPFTVLAILIDESQHTLFFKAIQKAVSDAQENNIQLRFITLSESDKDIMHKIPSDIEAVMLAPLLWMDTATKQKLIDGLLQRKIPSYALADAAMVEDGVLASSALTMDIRQRARRTALDIQATLHGEALQQHSFVLDEKNQLLINMQSARELNIPLNLKLLQNAVLLNKDDEKEPQLTLSSIAKEAIRANLKIIANKIGVAADKENIQEVRSVLFPQITGELSYSQLSPDNVYVENGFYAENSKAGAIKVEQLIFSEKILAKLEIQKQLHIAQQEQQRIIELEVVKNATTLFLNLLVAQTNYKIQSDNLNLTKSNLELAKGRVAAGKTDMSDVYYWQSAIASLEQNVLRTNAEVEKSKDLLNLILNRKISDRYKTKPLTLSQQMISLGKENLFGVIADTTQQKRMAEYLINEGVQNSPKLHQIDATIAAQQRELSSNERAYWSPNVALLGEVTHVFDEARNQGAGIDLNNKTDWQFGVRLSLPLYDGGLRSAKSSRSALKLRQLEINHQGEKELIEQSIRSDLHAIEASYPAIELSNQAAIAAQKSFLIVRENYAQGTRSMTDLLSAQNTTLVAQESAVNSVYRFIIDLLQLEHDIAAFDLFSEDTNFDIFTQKIADSIKMTEKEEF